MPRERKSRKPNVERTLRIFCEGEKTEPYYLKGYIDEFRENNRVAVVAIERTRKNTPIQLVDEAIALKKSDRSLPGDVFWVVYDRESVAKYSRAKHSEAWEKAVRAGINVALNNVCFEYWVLLHFTESSAAYSSYDDLRDNSGLRAEIQKLCGRDYEKSSQVIFSHLKAHISDARGRANRINRRVVEASTTGALPFDVNPYTGMPSLLDAIDGFK
ncbi:RloB family protein [Pseudooceanicola nanhaiensis]|uniref:RloB family protein n=1 Tax=Pseudooceanicola nanhaiensis TaxID=375761 RepID=UPI001CD6DA6B|nr:RloB family protein [Pseudooceanicola nanhaiensis]MCA0922765.1 RloB family protein [Pseudooceanicola nanhaiensis]